MRVAFELVIIENVYPELDCGHCPVKRELSDFFEVWADLFKEGHDVLAAVLKSRERGGSGWSEAPMRCWLDWELSILDWNLLAFVRRMIRLRKEHPAFRRRRFSQGRELRARTLRTSPGSPPKAVR